MLNILGGGPAGLAAAYYAGKRGLPFHLFEGGAEVGGNCRTLRWGDFLFDTGAHRLHDRNPEVTREIRELLGDDLLEVHAPSQIHWQGRFIDFPLAPLDLLRKLPARTLARIGSEIIRLRLARTTEPATFRERAVSAYGPTLAEMFLLNYSAKLWGEETDRLAPDVAGSRLRGLDLATFVAEAIGGRAGRTRHLDGSFYYPRLGIGTIFDRMSDVVGAANISCGARITGLVHDGARVRKLVINGTEEHEAGTVISTLPITQALTMLRPRPPTELLETALSMRFRHLVLGVFLVDRPQVTPNASVYFPGDEPYTRMYECRNRSPFMAPPGRTSIVLEIPCQPGEARWTVDDDKLGLELQESLERAGLLRAEEVLAFRSFRVPFAYPVLEVGFAAKAQRVADYLSRFENLHLLGRSAQFQYTHIHDMFRLARETIGTLAERHGAAPLSRTA